MNPLTLVALSLLLAAGSMGGSALNQVLATACVLLAIIHYASDLAEKGNGKGGDGDDFLTTVIIIAALVVALFINGAWPF